MERDPRHEARILELLRPSLCHLLSDQTSPEHHPPPLLPSPLPHMSLRPQPLRHRRLFAKIWICPFCFQRNHFPPNYASISDDNLPAELFPHYTTIKYSQDNQIDQSPPQPPLVFLFVIDSCLIEEEMGFLKSPIYKLRAS